MSSERPKHSTNEPAERSAQPDSNSLPLKIFPRQPEDWNASGKETASQTNQQTTRDRELNLAAGVNPARTVTITLGQIVPLLIDAVEKNRVWIEDFSDERVVIDADLYEVLLAYQRMRNRDAA